jgi:asparagine synthase (glutamine-hydrolysing)
VCGVNAVVAWRTDITSAQLRLVVEQMNRLLAHRGPDANGSWADDRVAVGHTRLKIIDPAGGRQPRVGNTQVLSFNGEIYNHRRLRAELSGLGRVFRDECDTEVLAVALETWGTDAISRLNGDFAFVAYERSVGRVLVCRDRLGVKPLYLKISDGDVIISSEIKAILAADQMMRPGSQPVLDRMGFLQTVLYGNPVAPTTCIAGIEALRGGELITVEVRSGRIERHRYWELGDRDDRDDDDQEAESDPRDRIAELLADAVALRMQSDVDYSTSLSGGLDSSLIAYLIGDNGGRTRAYTIGERSDWQHSPKSNMNGSDLDFAELVALETGHDLRAFSDLGGDVVAYVRRCTRARDALVTLANDVSMLKLFERVAKTDTVLLSGEGADEVFLGYFFNTDTRGEVGPYFSSPHARLVFALLDPRFVRARDAAVAVRRRFHRDLAHLPDAIRADKQKLMHYLQLRFTLTFVLDRADRLSAAHSLEVRVPYCDHRLVEYVFGLDTSLTFTPTEKQLLRDSFAGRFNDQVIRRRKSVFPYAEGDDQLDDLRREALQIVERGRRDGGLVADVYRLPVLARVLSSRRLLRRISAWSGSFYVQAFLCQLISLDELQQAYGVRA